MKKVLLAAALSAVSVSAMAEAPAFFANGEYRVFTGYTHTSTRQDDLRQTGNGAQLGVRADMPFDEHNGLRLEGVYTYTSVDSKDKTEGFNFSNNANANKFDVYAGYTYTHQVKDNTRFRGGIGLGYTHFKDSVHDKLVPGAIGFDTQRNTTYLKAHAEITQNLGGGWSLTPWTELNVDLYTRTKVRTTQLGASEDMNEKTNGWGVGLGLNAAKQFGSGNTAVEFGPYYRYTQYKQSGVVVLDGVPSYIGKQRLHETGLRFGVRF